MSTRLSELISVFANAEMRTLNHEHIFAFPLQRTNGLDLDTITPGLASMPGDFLETVIVLGHG